MKPESGDRVGMLRVRREVGGRCWESAGVRNGTAAGTGLVVSRRGVARRMVAGWKCIRQRRALAGRACAGRSGRRAPTDGVSLPCLLIQAQYGLSPHRYNTRR